MVSHFLCLHDKPQFTPYPKNRQKSIGYDMIIMYIPLLNALKILTVRLVENFKNT